MADNVNVEVTDPKTLKRFFVPTTPATTEATGIRSSWTDFFSRRTNLFFWIGLIMFASGIFLGVNDTSQHSILLTSVIHFLLIAGEALIVFYLINVVLEKQTKERFLLETAKLIAENERQIMESFDQLSRELLAKTNTLFADINNDIFRVILQERTSPEIAHQISKTDFFKSDFLKIEPAIEFVFSAENSDKKGLRLLEKDHFTIKSISKKSEEYEMKLIVTANSSKSYRIIAAGFSKHDKHSFKHLKQEDFDAVESNGYKSEMVYSLKDKVTVEPGENVICYREIETFFVLHPDGVDDYWFTSKYMMPFTLRVALPDGYEFTLYPSFDQDRLGAPYRIGSVINYDIPFLIPGQGFSFTVKAIPKPNKK